VGVNGDLFHFKDGHPTGMMMRAGVLESQPYRFRSSIGMSVDGKLNVARVGFFGYWQGLGQRRPLTGFNQPPRGDGTSLFTPDWGATTPRVPGAVEAVISPFPPATTGAELHGNVTLQTTGGGTPIPRDGAVLYARGTQAPKLAQEAPAATAIATRLILSPDWPSAGVTEALGGGPVLVRPARTSSPRSSAHATRVPRSARNATGRSCSWRSTAGAAATASASPTGSSPRRSPGSAPSRPPRSTRAARRRWRSTASSSTGLRTRAVSVSWPRA
jgi:hypothetical protein